MNYFLPEIKKQIANFLGNLLEVEPSKISVINASDSFEAELAVPLFAFAGAKNVSPAELASEMAPKLSLPQIEKTEAASGFINIWLKPQALAESFSEIDDWHYYGNTELYAGHEVLIEHTDPNPFKQLHIGHVYSNSVGESLAKLHEAAGALVHRLSYHGDVGLHVAKAMWGIQKELGDRSIIEIDETERAEFLGRSYAIGAKSYEEDDNAKADIEQLNQQIYKLEDQKLKEVYEIARKWSFDYFDSVYKRLNVPFEKKYFESDAAKVGSKLVEDNTPGVFEKSQDAIIFDGEKYGEHTRVFINSTGLPTYEAKDLGLMKLKQVDYPGAVLSIVVTAQEQAAYFRVMLKAMEQIEPELAAKTKHLAHGEVRLPSGKMSSRSGDVVTAVQLIDTVSQEISERSSEDSPAIDENTQAAIKYAFLKQNIGGNVVFDVDESISLEGQSGPYLQYAAVRINSIVKKVIVETDDWEDYDWQAERKLLFLLSCYPETVEEAVSNLQPHTVAQFLYELARELNRYYETVNVKNAAEQTKAARIFTLKAVRSVLKHGLNLLNIPIPDRM